MTSETVRKLISLSQATKLVIICYESLMKSMDPFPNYTAPLTSVQAIHWAWDVLSPFVISTLTRLQSSVQTPSLLKVFMDLPPQSD